MKALPHIEAAKFLFDNGLLFEFNRRILHPLGIALSVFRREDGEVIGFGPAWEVDGDPEGFYFDKDTFEEGKTKYEAFMKEFGEKRLEEREKTLGYVVQEAP